MSWFFPQNFVYKPIVASLTFSEEKKGTKGRNGNMGRQRRVRWGSKIIMMKSEEGGKYVRG